ncbi:phage tail tape measure protein [Vulcaniibacterium tengchongense]|uniref:TP901 family phage tail tape measure protein n=1 Tax=Vulcaniibacterium tengchongense TaxID=1273429 RepID=A0A3N4UV75_9GAMM|nr:phage tail tape measure protein [Vulcaniibacterium tengchongense]RPE74636.1 TP901 family phage tail tape measure protein [Vulcaniibacterium tengchongense]
MAGYDLRLQVLLNAIDRASGPLKRILGGSKSTAQALRATQSELKRLEAVQRDIEGFRKLETQLGTTSSQLVQAQRELRRLGEALNAADAPNKKLTASLRKQGEVVARLREEEARQRATLEVSRRALEAAGVSTARLAVDERRLQAELAAANRQLDAQRRRLERLTAAQAKMQRMHSAGMKLAAHGAGAVAAGSYASRAAVAPIAAFAEQEDAAMQLRAAMMGANGQVAAEFAQIDALAQKLGNRLPGTTADFYEMFTMLRRQGMSAQVILGGLGEATAYLGAQLRMPYTEAAAFAAKLQDATRATEAEMMGLADVIQRTYYLGVDAENMLQGFGKLSPALSILRSKGLAATQALAPLLVMADQAGMAGEQAGNAYRKVLQYAMDAEKVGKANALLKPSGIALDFTNGQGEFGGLDRLFAQLQQLKGLNTQDRLAVLKKLFGDDAETLQVVSLLIDKGQAGYYEVQRKMAAQADLQRRVNAQLGTLRNLWEAATGTFTNVLASVGETAQPEIQALTQWLGRAGERMQAWVQENPKLAGGLFKVAAVLAVLVVAAGGLALALGTILMPFAGLQFALTNAAPLFGGLGRLLLGLGGRILPLVAGAIRMVGMAVTANPIGILLMLLAGAAYLIWRNWGTIGPMLSGIWQSVSTAVGQAWDWLKAKAGMLWEFLKGVFAWSPLGLLITHWNAVLGFLGGLWARFQAIGGQLMQGLVRGLLGGLQAVSDTITGIAGNVIGWFKAKLGIRSPSRVFAQLGDFTMQGFAGGLDRSQRLPLQRFSAFGDRLQQAGAGVALAAAAAPAAAIDTRPPVAPLAAPSAAPAVKHYEIHVHAAPGMDPQAIAAEVRRQLEQLDRERDARRRSRLGDYD